MNINRAILFGRLTRDPETRTTPQGRTVTKFGLATNRNWKEGEVWKSAVDFHNVVAWAGLGERVKTLSKGDLVFVEGRIHNDVWEGADGQKRRNSEIVADRLYAVNDSASARASDDVTLDTLEVKEEA
ncbi:MAG: single-stranded DNA-binding protein [Candidatus Kerfeldbacteria bacterium]|nr:single-stranded DNA-binding protein [Candidatus Kerfeldbacteria bacterium]